MKRAEFGLEAGSFLAEVARHFSSGAASDAPGMVMGCNELRLGLLRIAQRAIQLNDEPLLTELRRLGCIRPSSSIETAKPKTHE